MALMATAGICTSCSNDNEPQLEESAQAPSIEQIKQVWNEVGQEMKSIDPAPLNEFIAALNAKGTKMTTRTIDEETGTEGEEAEVNADMINDLKELMASLLYIDGDEPGLKRSFSFVNVQHTFALLYEMEQVYIKQEGDDNLLEGEGTGKIKALGITVITDDNTKYDIMLARKKQDMTYPEYGDINSVKCSIAIKKNDAHFLEIMTGNSYGRYQSDESGDLNNMRIGLIKYLEHSVNVFFYVSPDEPTIFDVSYAKNDSELIDVRFEINHNSIATPYLPGKHSVDYIIKVKEGLVTVDGRINKVSTLMANVAAIGLTSKNGTTEAACVKLVNDFNDNVTANIGFAGTDIGDMLLGYRPVEGSVNYKPVIVISSPILGDTPLSLDEILDLLGITWDDIKGMISGLGD